MTPEYVFRQPCHLLQRETPTLNYNSCRNTYSGDKKVWLEGYLSVLSVTVTASNQVKLEVYYRGLNNRTLEKVCSINGSVRKKYVRTKNGGTNRDGGWILLTRPFLAEIPL